MFFTLGKNSDTHFSKVDIQYFFPHLGQKSDKVLRETINATEKTLDIAIFNFTDKSILNMILDAKKRGVNVRVITDKIMLFNPKQYLFIVKMKTAGILIKKISIRGLCI